MIFEVAVLYGFDLSQIFTPIILRLYQPHSLYEKGATRAAAKAALVVFLLAPLREGRRGVALCRQPDDLISTRAPTRGATRPGRRSARHAHGISTRAPTRGATRNYLRRRDGQFLISTHAPTRGATSLAAVLALIVFVFLLTPLREGRLAIRPGDLAEKIFLLTPLREGRQAYSRYSGKFLIISTHAPTRGATRFFVGLMFSLSSVFLLTPLREGRPAGRAAAEIGQTPISTHAPTRGATCAAVLCHVLDVVFLLTPLREGRPLVPSSTHS